MSAAWSTLVTIALGTRQKSATAFAGDPDPLGSTAGTDTSMKSYRSSSAHVRDNSPSDHSSPKGTPRPKGVATVKTPVEKNDPPPQVVKDEAIPEGTGKLVISVGDNTARHLITVQGEEWGTPPMNRKVASGIYRVSVKLENGAVSNFKAAVLPDKTTVLTLDPGSMRWSSRSQ